MGGVDDLVQQLRSQVIATERQLSNLKEQLANAERAAAHTKQPSKQDTTAHRSIADSTDLETESKHAITVFPLKAEEYKRYGRQLIMPEVGIQDYDEFCGVLHPINILGPQERTSPETYHKIRQTSGSRQILVDVREKVHFDLCHLPSSVNIPYSDFRSNPTACIHSLQGILDSDPKLAQVDSLYFICRLGNDSQHVVRQIKELKKESEDLRFGSLIDIRGGLQAWRQQVDPDFPEY
ncbi:hypothetical protein P7C71_g6537, partial [Lecanoromycetidae sp. Uapishka_2]